MNTEAITELLKKTTEFSKNGGSFEEFAVFVISTFDLTLKEKISLNVNVDDGLPRRILAVKKDVQKPVSSQDLVGVLKDLQENFTLLEEAKEKLTGKEEKQSTKGLFLLDQQAKKRETTRQNFETALSENHLSNQFWRANPNSEGKDMVFGSVLPTTVPIEKFFSSVLLEGFQSWADRTAKLGALFARQKLKIAELLNKKIDGVAMFDIDENEENK